MKTKKRGKLLIIMLAAAGLVGALAYDKERQKK